MWSPIIENCIAEFKYEKEKRKYWCLKGVKINKVFLIRKRNIFFKKKKKKVRVHNYIHTHTHTDR